MRLGILGLILIFLAEFSEAKFARGDDFQYVSLDGILNIVCDDRTKTVQCHEIFLDPWPYDSFVGPRLTQAQRVSLQAAVGSEIQNAAAHYDGGLGRSSEINLGVFSLFQKPLLKIGENHVRYSIMDRNEKVLDIGTFNVSVTRGKSRTCNPREIVSDNVDDCDNTYSMCQIYFKNQNYCR